MGLDLHRPRIRTDVLIAQRGGDTDFTLCAPGRDRTCDLRFRKPSLYPLSYEGVTTK